LVVSEEGYLFFFDVIYLLESGHDKDYFSNFALLLQILESTEDLWYLICVLTNNKIIAVFLYVFLKLITNNTTNDDIFVVMYTYLLKYACFCDV
jgi:hypothetical protein